MLINKQWMNGIVLCVDIAIKEMVFYNQLYDEKVGAAKVVSILPPSFPIQNSGNG